MSLHGTGRAKGKKDKLRRKLAVRRSKAKSSLIYDPWPAVEARLDTLTMIEALRPVDPQAANALSLLLTGATQAEIAVQLRISRRRIRDILSLGRVFLSTHFHGTLPENTPLGHTSGPLYR